MAKSRQKQSSSSRDVLDQQKVPVRFVPGHDKGIPVHYSNYAAISHTTDDFSIDFCLLAPPYDVRVGGDDKKEKSAIVVAPVMVRIVVPPRLIQGLIKALQIEEARFNKRDPDTLEIPILPGDDTE